MPDCSAQHRMNTYIYTCKIELKTFNVSGLTASAGLQVPGYATQSHCTRAGGLDTTNGPVTVLDQCVAEQYYVRNSILRSLIYAHVSPARCALPLSNVSASTVRCWACSVSMQMLVVNLFDRLHDAGRQQRFS